ncbi:MAG: TIGR01777 family protein [Deltaproteobacteria bacterium]|nr:TIGR01777 family protein [Deltaproteobacteria bacterium]
MGGGDARLVAVTGSTGLIGRSLCARLVGGGFRVRRLVRRAARRADETSWDPSAARLDSAVFDGVDAVVHLAGENLSAGRWTRLRKESLLRSRVEGTGLLARTLAALPRPPGVLLSASAVGWYGDRGDEELDESSAPGSGFLADVCARWEAATEPARDTGIRVVLLRSGVVLSGDGGALPRMARPFRLFAGGRVGSGRQWVSWIAREDAVGAILHLLSAGEVSGPVNLVAPQPTTNAELSRAIGRALHRPCWLPVPRFALRLAFGEMADVVLGSTRVLPRRLTASGYAFRCPNLAATLATELG